MKNKKLLYKILAMLVISTSIFNIGCSGNISDENSNKNIPMVDVTVPEDEIIYNPQKTMDKYFSNCISLNEIMNEPLTYAKHDITDAEIEHRYLTYATLVDNYEYYFIDGDITLDALVEVDLTFSKNDEVLLNVPAFIDGRTYDYSFLYTYLIGANVGDNLTKDIILPETLTNDLQVNDKCTVDILIKGYYLKQYPEINDDFVKEWIIPMFKQKLNTTPTFVNLEEFQEYIRDELEREYIESNETKKTVILDNIIKSYMDKYCDNYFTINEEQLSQMQKDIIRPYMMNLAKLDGIEYEAWCVQKYNISSNTLERNSTIELMKQYAIIMEIAREQGIVVTKQDCANNLLKYYKIMAEKNGTTITEEQTRYEQYPDNFYILCLKQKVYETLINGYTIN